MIKKFRKELPQITEDILQGSCFSYEFDVVRREIIVPIQKDRLKDSRKIQDRITKVLNNTYRPLVLDSQYHLIDGHHRLDALIICKIPIARVLVIDAPLEDILLEFSSFQNHQPTLVA
tara:strand:- start:441 stop:794 length:354 start_codon:yes stop_codon:yes gene_type:complete